MGTRIEWCDETWNPIKMRCTKVSEGCQNCYAERLLSRNLPAFEGYPDKGEGPVLDCLTLTQPLFWKKPRRIFVESMGDLFHEDVPESVRNIVIDTADKCPQHTFMILTKRAKIMAEHMMGWFSTLIPPNIWLGVTAENQRTADERIPVLLSIPAAVHFVSVEPMLGPVSLGLLGTCSKSWGLGYSLVADHLNWVICGAETGPKARKMNKDWAIDLAVECKEASVPFFFKKWSKGCVGEGMPREFPVGGLSE